MSEIKEPYPTEFNAMGIPVPSNRLDKGQAMIRQILPNATSEDVFAIVGKFSNAIRNDNTYSLVGAVETLDEDLDKIDVTGRYMILASMLTD